eukprot:GHUV01014591.1.p1 GENE.GHUV01014591.1~~GHUV01014591.1.p1  ORF type:complete len:158 (+),score=28.80 GHUV01014591.1:107-580(+)
MSLMSRSSLLLRCHALAQSQLCIGAGSQLFSSGSDLQQGDKIVMKGMVFHGYHGALPEENALGQKFVVDATLWTDLRRAGQSDQLQDTLDYARVYKQVQTVIEGPARQLQETVAEELCQHILQLDARVTAVQVYLRKPHVALTGTLESVGVEIFRRK